MYLFGGVMGILLSLFALFVERVFPAVRAILVEFQAARIVLAFADGVIP
jgi:hypothetical protein